MEEKAWAWGGGAWQVREEAELSQALKPEDEVPGQRGGVLRDLGLNGEGLPFSVIQVADPLRHAPARAAVLTRKSDTRGNAHITVLGEEFQSQDGRQPCVFQVLN